MMKEQIIEILEDIQPEADYETCQTLIDDHILTSLDVLSLVAELEDEFDVTIPTVEIIPSNFNSVDAIAAMVERLQEEGLEMKSYVAPLYLLVFLPAVVFLYNIVPKKLRPVVLLLASYLFFWSISGKLILFLLISTFSIHHFWVVAVKPSGRT